MADQAACCWRRDPFHAAHLPEYTGICRHHTGKRSSSATLFSIFHQRPAWGWQYAGAQLCLLNTGTPSRMNRSVWFIFGRSHHPVRRFI
jgi:hypothetical protein